MCNHFLFFASLSTINFVTATNTALLGIYLSHGLSLIGRRESTILNYLPSSFFVMSALFALLQPEFNISEVSVCVCVYYLFLRVDINFSLDFGIILDHTNKELF